MPWNLGAALGFLSEITTGQSEDFKIWVFTSITKGFRAGAIILTQIYLFSCCDGNILIIRPLQGQSCFYPCQHVHMVLWENIIPSSWIRIRNSECRCVSCLKTSKPIWSSVILFRNLHEFTVSCLVAYSGKVQFGLFAAGTPASLSENIFNRTFILINHLLPGHAYFCLWDLLEPIPVLLRWKAGEHPGQVHWMNLNESNTILKLEELQSYILTWL